MPKLSIIMPARDAGGTLRAAIVSTLRAAPVDSELLVYDDASTDDTARIVEEHRRADGRVKLVSGPSGEGNIGPARARNRLIAESDSKYVAAMDADDVCLPHRFFRIDRRLDRCDLTFAPIIRFAGKKILHYPRPAPLSAEALPLALLTINPLPQSTMIARRSQNSGQLSYKDGPAQDYELWLRLCSEGARITFTSAPTVLYRHHSGQSTQRADYEERVRRSESIHKSYDALSERLGLPVIRKLERQELKRIIEEKIANLASPKDRDNLLRLASSSYAFPLSG